LRHNFSKIVGRQIILAPALKIAETGMLSIEKHHFLIGLQCSSLALRGPNQPRLAMVGGAVSPVVQNERRMVRASCAISCLACLGDEVILSKRGYKQRQAPDKRPAFMQIVKRLCNATVIRLFFGDFAINKEIPLQSFPRSFNNLSNQAKLKSFVRASNSRT
jgi:hypothetical protein